VSLPLRQPRLTVDAIVEAPGGIVLVSRRFPPLGWALPGGFVDWGETLEAAAAREVLEETGLAVADLRQFRAYSDPARDPRGHTVTMVFTARAEGEPKGGDDAAEARVFPVDSLPADIVFDHRQILDDYLARRSTP
jgi:8-oxo-dGTP diphosphatase